MMKLRFRGIVLVVFVFWVLVGQGLVFAQSTQEQLKQIRSSVVETIDGREFYIHTIRRGQTLYMISKAYGVEVNDLIRENPQVKEGIKADEKLRIPTKNQPAKPQKPKVDPIPVVVKAVEPDSIIQKPDSAVQPLLPCGIDNTTKKEIYKVALMLPLFLGDVGLINTDNPDRKTIENTRSFQFLPFYEGFRLAVDSLEKLGLSVRLYVYDVDKDTVKTRQLLKKPEFKTMDLIIGLLYHSNFEIVSAFAEKNKINIVNPVSERKDLILGNQFVFKVQPDKKSKAAQLADYLSKNCRDGQILIIRSGQAPDREFPDKIKQACSDLNLNVKIAEGQDAAISQLSKDTENYLVAFSEKAEYTIELTRRLYELRNSYSITLFGLPDWSAINGIETEYLVTLKTHMMAPAFVDYQNPEVKKFVNRYQNEYMTDPELLAFQGFDVAFYFITALNQFGTNFGRCLNGYRINSLQTRYNFSSTPGNGYENSNWVIFYFENFRKLPGNF